jgi:hypothetical protein
VFPRVDTQLNKNKKLTTKKSPTNVILSLLWDKNKTQKKGKPKKEGGKAP